MYTCIHMCVCRYLYNLCIFIVLYIYNKAFIHKKTMYTYKNKIKTQEIICLKEVIEICRKH